MLKKRHESLTGLNTCCRALVAFITHPMLTVSVEAHKYCLIARPRWKLYARQETALHDADLNSYRHIERKNRKGEVLTFTKMLVYAPLSTNLGCNLLILKKMVEKTLGFLW